MGADVIVALISNLGPVVEIIGIPGALIGVLLFAMFRKSGGVSAPPSIDFSAEQKLYLKTHVSEPILEEVRELTKLLN